MFFVLYSDICSHSALLLLLLLLLSRVQIAETWWPKVGTNRELLLNELQCPIRGSECPHDALFLGMRWNRFFFLGKERLFHGNVWVSGGVTRLAGCFDVFQIYHDATRLYTTSSTQRIMTTYPTLPPQILVSVYKLRVRRTTAKRCRYSGEKTNAGIDGEPM